MRGDRPRIKRIVPRLKFTVVCMKAYSGRMFFIMIRSDHYVDVIEEQYRRGAKILFEKQVQTFAEANALRDNMIEKFGQNVTLNG